MKVSKQNTKRKTTLKLAAVQSIPIQCKGCEILFSVETKKERERTLREYDKERQRLRLMIVE